MVFHNASFAFVQQGTQLPDMKLTMTQQEDYDTQLGSNGFPDGYGKGFLASR